jgi:hypothetical protein
MFSKEQLDNSTESKQLAKSNKEKKYKKMGFEDDSIRRKSSMFYPYDRLNETVQEPSSTKHKLNKAISNMKKLFGF